MKLLRQIYALLTGDERHEMVKMWATIILTSILDLVGIAVLIPAIFVVFGDNVNRQNALVICISALLVVAVKNSLILGMTRYRNKFMLTLYRRLSLKLFRYYYNSGLLFLRRNNIYRLSFDVINTCHFFAFNLLSPLLYMAGELLLIVMITVGLLFYKPMLVILLYMTFIPFAVIYIFAIRKRLRQYGKIELDERRRQNNRITEAFAGYSQLEINDALPSIAHRVELGLKTISDVRIKLSTIQFLPSGFSELAVIAALSVIILFADSAELRTTLGMFGVVALRLMPSLRNVISCWSQVQNYSYAIDVISECNKEQEPIGKGKPQDMTFDDCIKIEHLCYTYPDGKQVLDDLNCTIKHGEYVGIKGQSGIGKSTLFNILLGFIRPDSGQVTIDGTVLDETNIKSWQRLIGYVAQETYIIEGTIAENIALGLDDIDRDKVLALLKLVEFPIEDMENGIDQQIGLNGSLLSGGQKQRIAIARALYKGTKLLLLDEATSALDSESEHAINQMLRTIPDVTVIIITHRDTALADCDRTIAIG
jgi:ABC-type bacteriocin/lantibiotic exporter with double-glycine peptidase domain